MKTTFYKDGDNFLMATGESPKGFEKVLFVVWEGSIDNLKEGVRTTEQLKKLEKVHVDEIDCWADAFAKASGVVIQKATKRKAGSTSARRDTPLDEFVGHCAAGTDVVTAAVVSGIIDEQSKPSELQPNEAFHACVVWACIAASFVFYGVYLCL
jgi:hypothetical protein